MRVTDAAKGRWCEILPKLGYNPPSNPKVHGPCPICGGKDRFRFDDIDGTGSWICNQCGAGDGMDLAGHLVGKDFKGTRLEVFKILQINPEPQSNGQSNGPDQFQIAIKRVWSGATFVKWDSPPGMYLRTRTGVQQSPKSLRYHPALFNPTVQSKLPAMIAPVQGPSGNLVNLHCTFLTPDGQKADVSPAKRVMAGPLPDGCAIRLAPANEFMGIAEGIETAISASLLYALPVWAAVNGMLLSKWVPPEQAKRIYVFADNDASYTGQSKAYALANRLVVQHKLEVEVLVPPQAGDDWNDYHRRMNYFDSR